METIALHHGLKLTVDRSDAIPYATAAPAPTMPTLNESDDVDDEEFLSLMSAVV